jgi:predicted RNase H-like HicB family nuclease
MRIINVTYHQETEGWWAESVDVPTFFAAGASRDEVRQYAQEYLPQIAGGPIDELREAEFTQGPVLLPLEHPGEWGSPIEGLTLSWFGATAVETA